MVMELIHGGDVYSYAAAHGGAMPLDLSANINPFGIPPRVSQAMHHAIAHCERYPDPLCRALRRAIGEAQQVDEDGIFCGNGAAEVLFRLSAVIRPQCALLTAPTFAEYEQSLSGCELRFHLLRENEGFALTERFLDALTPDLDAVYLCNPNNPTGRTIDPALLREIVARCKQNGTWLIVDECFLDFLQEEERHTLRTVLPDYDRLVLLRAFTKMYAVPGVRLGYCMSANTTLIDALYRAGQPWNVSVIAQACGVAATREREFVRQTAVAIARERDALTGALRARGLNVYPAQANFVLLHTRDRLFGQKLAQKGILVRDCSNYRGLSPGYYRIAVRDESARHRLLAALDD